MGGEGGGGRGEVRKGRGEEGVRGEGRMGEGVRKKNYLILLYSCLKDLMTSHSYFMKYLLGFHLFLAFLGRLSYRVVPGGLEVVVFNNTHDSHMVQGSNNTMVY